MNKKLFAAVTVFAMLFFTSSANAEEVVQEGPVFSLKTTSEPDPPEGENVDTLPLPSQELIEQNPWVESSVAPEGQVPRGQDEPETWAIVDSNGNTLNIIVCDIDYCGSGWIPVAYDGFTPTEWARVVLQSQRNPETGNFGGGHWGQYNFSTNTWTQTDESGSVYQIPVEYGAERICISNCPVSDPSLENPYSDSLILTQQSDVPTKNNDEGPATSPRSIVVKPEIINNSIPLNIKIKGKVFNNRVTIVATKNGKQKIWNKRLKKNVLSINIPKKYSSWKISVRYRVF
jgi:hypothetical protein